jgi:hypothetical protein
MIGIEKFFDDRKDILGLYRNIAFLHSRFFWVYCQNDKSYAKKKTCQIDINKIYIQVLTFLPNRPKLRWI